MAPQFVKPFVKSNKNDAIDAEAICEAIQRPNMRFVAIKNTEQQDVLAIHRMRSLVVGQRTALVNQIRGLLQEFGIVIAKASKSVGFLNVESKDKIVVKWKLDHKKLFNETSFEIETLKSVAKKTNKIVFNYSGENNWVLKAYEEKSWDNKTLLETVKGTNLKLN